MPPGSRKRKSAKRKKENDSNNHIHPNSLREFGYEKHQEDYESYKTNLLRVGEEEELGPVDSISNLQSVDRLENEGVEEQNSIVEEGNVIAEKESRCKHGNDELVVPARMSYDVSKPERSNSRTSPYDESCGIVKIKSKAGDIPAIDPRKEEESLSEIHPAVDLEESLILKENGQVNMSSQNDSYVASLLVDSARKENREKSESFIEEKYGISEEFSSGKENDQSVNDTCLISKLKECDDRVTLLYNEPRATADSGAENGKHSGVTEPLLTPRQEPTETASWKNCCGLFAMFTVPGR